MTERADKKLIILDCDGVLLLDTDPIYEEGIGGSLDHVGVGMDEEKLQDAIDSYWGYPPARIPRLILEQMIIVKPEILADNPKVIAQAENYYADYIQSSYAERSRALPGVDRVLGALANKYALALNTAADEEILFNSIFPKIGIHDKITLFRGTILTAKDFEDGQMQPKPEPDSTLELMRRNGVEPEETVMVGDSVADILTAVNAGVEDVVVPLTGKTDEITAEIYRNEFGVTVIPSLHSLEQVLGSMPVRHLAGSDI